MCQAFPFFCLKLYEPCVYSTLFMLCNCTGPFNCYNCSWVVANCCFLVSKSITCHLFVSAPYAPPVNWNFKSGAAAAAAKDRTAIGKDNKHIDVDAVGTVNGVSIHEFDLDSVDDKPWRKPGKNNYSEISAACLVFVWGWFHCPSWGSRLTDWLVGTLKDSNSDSNETCLQ